MWSSNVCFPVLRTLKCFINRKNCNLHQFLSCLLTLHCTTISDNIWLLMMLLTDQTSSWNNDRLQSRQLRSDSCWQQPVFHHHIHNKFTDHPASYLVGNLFYLVGKVGEDRSWPLSSIYIVCFVVWHSHLGIVHHNVAQTKLVQKVTSLVCIQQVYILSPSQDTNHPNTEFVISLGLSVHTP